MNMKNIFSMVLLLAVVTLSLQCSNTVAENSKGTLLKGTIENATDIKLFLDRSGFGNQNEVIGNTDIDGSGSFKLDLGKQLEAGIYRIRIGAKRIFLPFAGDEKTVTINGDLSTIQNYKVDIKGSEAAQSFASTMNDFVNKKIDRKGVKMAIEKSENPLVAMWLALNTQGTGVSAGNLELHKSISQKLTAKYPDSKYTEDYSKVITQAETQIAAQRALEKIKVGEVAPDIEMKGPDGKTHKLSDLRGKLVLLDFWASWCRPCRKANPHVVEMYKKYNDQGFEVFSVSLDGINPRLLPRLQDQSQIDAQLENAKNRWIAAIEKDELLWDTHVSDLKHWNSPVAKMYGVRSIPKTFLIDRDGKIAMVGVNPLRGGIEDLIKKYL